MAGMELKIEVPVSSNFPPLLCALTNQFQPDRMQQINSILLSDYLGAFVARYFNQAAHKLVKMGLRTAAYQS